MTKLTQEEVVAAIRAEAARFASEEVEQAPEKLPMGWWTAARDERLLAFLRVAMPTKEIARAMGLMAIQVQDRIYLKGWGGERRRARNNLVYNLAVAGRPPADIVALSGFSQEVVRRKLTNLVKIGWLRRAQRGLYEDAKGQVR